MRFRSPGSRLPIPLGDMLVFAATVAGFLILWRLSGNPIDCSALAGGVGCAVGLGWLESYRRARAGTPARTTPA